MADSAEELITELLTGTVAELDVPPSVDRTVHAVYDDVGRWMSHTLEEGKWSIYPQGSARLGTMVRRPDQGEYDIDTVVEWDVNKATITQQTLKDEVGEALDSYVKARAASGGPAPTGCDESRRCWTLTFNEPFHMDVLPAIPDLDAPPSGILLPDRALLRWQFSDPTGFAEWFADQMAAELAERRTEAAKAASVEVEQVPTWQVRTTLQRVVQVLKAHRNHFFADDDPDRPPSILITTLAAQAFQGERQLLEAVMNAASRMPSLIQRDGPTYVVLNPVQDRENFADLWTLKAEARFFGWIDDLQQTLDAAVSNRTGLHGAVAALVARFGVDPVQKGAANYGALRNTDRVDGRLKVAATGVLGATGLPVRPHTFHGA